MQTNEGTSIEALMEQLIETGPEDKASVRVSVARDTLRRWAGPSPAGRRGLPTWRTAVFSHPIVPCRGGGRDKGSGGAIADR